jgi:hypothetical protein
MANTNAKPIASAQPSCSPEMSAIAQHNRTAQRLKIS